MDTAKWLYCAAACMWMAFFMETNDILLSADKCNRIWIGLYKFWSSIFSCASPSFEEVMQPCFGGFMYFHRSFFSFILSVFVFFRGDQAKACGVDGNQWYRLRHSSVFAFWLRRIIIITEQRELFVALAYFSFSFTTFLRFAVFCCCIDSSQLCVCVCCCYSFSSFFHSLHNANRNGFHQQNHERLQCI